MKNFLITVRVRLFFFPFGIISKSKAPQVPIFVSIPKQILPAPNEIMGFWMMTGEKNAKRPVYRVSPHAPGGCNLPGMEATVRRN